MCYYPSLAKDFPIPATKLHSTSHSHRRGHPSVLSACITLTVRAELAFAVPLVVICRHISWGTEEDR